ncbi:hypothetical protein ACHAXA_001010 [Cyclostephanos tholiformis]|uniref:Helicase-associated domain-containing protein n=1 Tax=Cyclostephanos tholiformis TaxID=382380 RepID=A0ABD3SEE6_9STRA
MTSVSGCASQLKGTLRSVFKPIGAAGPLKYSILINKRPVKYAISSNLAGAARASRYNDGCNTQRFFSLSGSWEIRSSSSDAAGKAGELFDVFDDDDNITCENMVEASRRKAHWDRMFNDLKSYVAVNGDTLVPRIYPDNQQLGSWVDNQRQAYRMGLEAKALGEKKLDHSDGNKYYARDAASERVEKLNSIGFVWNLYDHFWNMRYEELKEYVAEHGDSIVPWNYAKNQSLGLWVVKQRRNFKVRQLRVDSGEAILSKERIDKLNAIGFIWDVHEAQWLERLQDLRVYKESHGDTLVPKMYPANILLGRWVNTQRLDYTRYQKIKEFKEKWSDVEVVDYKVREEMERLMSRGTGMTEKRIQLLDAEGFVWDAHAHVWESRFQELCNFVALNGHAVIQERKGGTYDPLARWASTQRQNYRKHQTGKHTTLTEEKIKKLNSIGFAWNTKGESSIISAKTQPRAK